MFNEWNDLGFAINVKNQQHSGSQRKPGNGAAPCADRGSAEGEQRNQHRDRGDFLPGNQANSKQEQGNDGKQNIQSGLIKHAVADTNRCAAQCDRHQHKYCTGGRPTQNKLPAAY